MGVVSEQSPRGGAITLNVVAGIGMLGAGVIVLDRRVGPEIGSDHYPVTADIALMALE